MSWPSLQQTFDSLKQQAAIGLIPGYALYSHMEEARKQENLHTLSSMFRGTNFGESMLEEVLSANDGSMKKAVDVLLEMSEQMAQMQARQREEEELLLRIKRESELEMEKKKEKENVSTDEMEFVHVGGEDPPTDNLNVARLDYPKGPYSSDNFFETSWIPLEEFSSASPTSLNYENRNDDILSASVTGTAAKGLKNGLGENNCFLNVVVQSLWHLKAFRTKFIDSNHHSHTNQVKEDACPYCALKIIFTQYQFGEEKELPPTILRKAMSVLFKSKSRFQMGSLNDAAEFHDALMTLLHHCVTDGNEKANSFLDKVFSLHVIDYMKCECGKPQRPFPAKQFIFHVNADTIRNQNDPLVKDGQKDPSFIGLDRAIHRANELDIIPCANPECKRKNPLRHALANLPEVFTIGVDWDTAKPNVDYIYEIMNLISKEIKVEEMFDSVVAKGRYLLRGMITYYGLHYNAFIRNPASGEWLGFDDSRVFKVGSWDGVVAKCCSGHWQPSVLWYEYCNA